MIYVFYSDGTYKLSALWQHSDLLPENIHMYQCVVTSGDKHIWYICRKTIGPMGINESDVPEEYKKLLKMLKLVLPKQEN